MTRAMLRTALPAAGLLALAGAVLAQVRNPPPPPPPVPANPPAANQPTNPPSPGAAPHAWRVKQVLGSKVLIQGNTGVGTVDDIVMSDDGQIEYFIVATEGGKYVTVPFEAAKFNYEQRTAVIEIPAERFKTIPTYTATAYPDFYAPAYRTEVYKVYGLTPREWRRLDRGRPVRP